MAIFQKVELVGSRDITLEINISHKAFLIFSLHPFCCLSLLKNAYFCLIYMADFLFAMHQDKKLITFIYFVCLGLQGSNDCIMDCFFIVIVMKFQLPQHVYNMGMLLFPAKIQLVAIIA